MGKESAHKWMKNFEDRFGNLSRKRSVASGIDEWRTLVASFRKLSTRLGASQNCWGQCDPNNNLTHHHGEMIATLHMWMLCYMIRAPQSISSSTLCTVLKFAVCMGSSARGPLSRRKVALVACFVEKQGKYILRPKIEKGAGLCCAPSMFGFFAKAAKSTQISVVPSRSPSKAQISAQVTP